MKERNLVLMVIIIAIIVITLFVVFAKKTPEPTTGLATMVGGC